MNPEQRVENALDEFEGLVVEGHPLEAAASIAGASYSLRPDVVLKRAKDRFGDLNIIAERVARERSAAARAARLKRAVFQYNSTFFGQGSSPEPCDVVEWVERELGLELTVDEGSWAVGEMNEALRRSMTRDLEDILKRNRRPSAQN